MNVKGYDILMDDMLFFHFLFEDGNLDNSKVWTKTKLDPSQARTTYENCFKSRAEWTLSLDNNFQLTDYVFGKLDINCMYSTKFFRKN